MGISQPGNNGQNTAGDMIQTGEDLPHEPQWATPTVEDMVCLGEGCSWGLADHVSILPPPLMIFNPKRSTHADNG